MKLKRLKNVNSLSCSHDISHQALQQLIHCTFFDSSEARKSLTDILHYMMRDESSNAWISQIQSRAHKRNELCHLQSRPVTLRLATGGKKNHLVILKALPSFLDLYSKFLPPVCLIIKLKPWQSSQGPLEKCRTTDGNGGLKKKNPVCYRWLIATGDHSGFL